MLNFPFWLKSGFSLPARFLKKTSSCWVKWIQNWESFWLFSSLLRIIKRNWRQLSMFPRKLLTSPSGFSRTWPSGRSSFTICRKLFILPIFWMKLSLSGRKFPFFGRNLTVSFITVFPRWWMRSHALPRLIFSRTSCSLNCSLTICGWVWQCPSSFQSGQRPMWPT